jgi:Ser/Thr protein kinase RdoA (MazF antagonist)
VSLLEQAPRFEPRTAAQIARDLYRLDAAASPLPGERDQNFLLETPSGRFVLKVANAAEERSQLEAQNAALDHVERLGLCPRVVRSVNGSAIERAPGGYLVRLLTWVPGVPLGTIPRHSSELLEDVGRRLGELDATLLDFDHPAIHRSFHWDLANGFLVVAEHSARVADAPLRALVERVTEQVERRDGARLGRLRRSAIHGDANDYNVLVTEGADGRAPAHVAGLIDFGDLVHSYTIADLAIAAAYAVLDKPDPLAAAAAVAAGYHGARPIDDEELPALFGLVKLRLCASVCLAAYQQPARPSDEYLAVSQAPIRRTLPRLAAIEPELAEAELRTCRM